jgi:hypothetical protein
MSEAGDPSAQWAEQLRASICETERMGFHATAAAMQRVLDEMLRAEEFRTRPITRP